MARVLGNPFGDLRGKLGGAVFSRNKSGAIVRVYTKNTDRKSDSQVDRRSRFGNVASLWASIPGSVKSNWNQYAESGFAPKRGKKPGSYTGFSAFVSIEANKANFGINMSPLSMLVPDLASVTQSSSFEPIGHVPTKSLTGGVYDATTEAYIKFTNSQCCFRNADTVGVKVFLESETTTNNHLFTNASNDNPFSFVVFASEVLSYEGASVKNPFRYMVANGIFTTPVTGWSATDNIEFDMAIADSWYKNTNKPTTADMLLLTLCIFDASGQISVVGQNYSLVA